MPVKRRTRAASRSKPVLKNITNKLNITDLKEHQRRAFLIDDFHQNVAMRLEMLKEEGKQLEATLWKCYEIYRQQLLPWQNVSVQQLLQCDDNDGFPKPLPQASKQEKNAPTSVEDTKTTDGLCGDELGDLTSSMSAKSKKASLSSTDPTQGCISAGMVTIGQGTVTETVPAQSAFSGVDTSERTTRHEVQTNSLSNAFAKPNPVSTKSPRMSDVSALIADAAKLTAVKPKKKGIRQLPALPQSATRTSSRLRKADGPLTHLAPPNTARVSRTKKNGEVGMFVTPAGQRVLTKLGSQLLVTPKFDPRVPLPSNTQLRRPLPREVPMSITGSPLSLSPDKPKLKEIMGEFLETLKREVPSLDHKDIQQFHTVLQRHLDHKP